MFISQLFHRFFPLNSNLFLEAFESHHLEKLIILLYFPACPFVESLYHLTETLGSFFNINVSVFLGTLYAERPQCEVKREAGHRLDFAIWPGSQEMG